MPLVAVLGTVFGLLATRRTGKILVGTVIADQIVDGRRAKKKLEESERLFSLGFNPEKERREAESKVPNPMMLVRINEKNLPDPEGQSYAIGEYLWTQEEMQLVHGYFRQEVDVRSGKIARPYFSVDIAWLLHIGKARMQDSQVYNMVVKPEEMSKLFWAMMRG